MYYRCHITTVKNQFRNKLVGEVADSDLSISLEGFNDRPCKDSDCILVATGSQ